MRLAETKGESIAKSTNIAIEVALHVSSLLQYKAL